MKTKKLFSCLLALALLFSLAGGAGAAANKKGDIDGDGAVTAMDARLALRCSVGLEVFTPRQRVAAAVGGSKTITAAEARTILRMSVSLDDADAIAKAAVARRLNAMSAKEKIEQMIITAVRNYGGADVTQLGRQQADMLRRHAFAGVILFAPNTKTAEQTLRLTDALQKANRDGGDRTQLLIAADQEGGKITRLVTGTQTPGNMALGAIGDEAAAEKAAGIIGAELAALGINTDLAPVMDVNSEPANPVIGVRSFSDRPALAAKLGAAYIRGLQNNGVLGTMKHFPGHGDTGTDSHTGLPRIEKTYAQIKQEELVPFAAGIAEGAELVMTAHIQFPKIEQGTYVSRSTGRRIALPATLSETFITKILRGDMGFRGVVVTDAMNMDAIAKHFDPIDAAVLAINAGVDLLLMPVDTSTDALIAQQDAYIDRLTRLAEQGTISMKKVNAAVERILRLKYDRGLFDAYQSPDMDEAVAAAKATVGSAAHHEAEWALAKRAVTLLKNSGGALPIRSSGNQTKRVLLLAAYQNEVLSMRYGAERLRAEGKLPAGTVITADCYADAARMSTILSEVQKADYVLAVSELYRQSALNPNSSANAATAKLDRILSAAHRSGGKFVLISANLPYDAARFQGADAILVCWSDMGMSEDPRVPGRETVQYGPNIPAAVYLALSPDESPAGKLPVDIPKLSSSYTYTGSVLYPFGFGLRY